MRYEVVYAHQSVLGSHAQLPRGVDPPIHQRIRAVPIGNASPLIGDRR